MWWEIARDVLAAAAALVAVVGFLAAVLSRLVNRLRRKVLPAVGEKVYKWLVPPEGRRLVEKSEPVGHVEPLPPGELVTRDLTYIDVEEAVAKLAEQIRHYEPDVLAAVDRGGAIVAGLIAKKLKKVREIVAIVSIQRRETPTPVAYGLAGDVAGKRVALIDDAFRTGEAMTLAKKCVEEKGAGDVKMAVILLEKRQRRKGSAATASQVTAVYHTEMLNVEFPWDVHPLDVNH
jgi:xanthine phosphoribosyltransferase